LLNGTRGSPPLPFAVGVLADVEGLIVAGVPIGEHSPPVLGRLELAAGAVGDVGDVIHLKRCCTTSATMCSATP